MTSRWTPDELWLWVATNEIGRFEQSTAWDVWVLPSNWKLRTTGGNTLWTRLMRSRNTYEPVYYLAAPSDHMQRQSRQRLGEYSRIVTIVTIVHEVQP